MNDVRSNPVSARNNLPINELARERSIPVSITSILFTPQGIPCLRGMEGCARRSKEVCVVAGPMRDF